MEMQYEEPTLKYLGKDNWKIVERVVLTLDDGTVIDIPAGGVTDLASIPHMLWGVEGPFELSTLAPVVHDDRYRNGIGTKADADALFRRLMLAQGVSPMRARLAYWAVKWFGGKSWKGTKS